MSIEGQMGEERSIKHSNAAGSVCAIASWSVRRSRRALYLYYSHRDSRGCVSDSEKVNLNEPELTSWLGSAGLTGWPFSPWDGHLRR